MQLPDYQTFLSGNRLTDFWQIVKWFLFFVAPCIMIAFALEAVMELIKRTIRAITGKEAEDDYYYDDDDDDDDDD